jgi:hypothetical protein
MANMPKGKIRVEFEFETIEGLVCPFFLNVELCLELEFYKMTDARSVVILYFFW